MTLYLGLMSGTSMDGIDAALVDLPGNQLVHGMVAQYSDEVAMRLQQLMHSPQVTLESVCQLNTLIGREFAAAANSLIRAAGVNPAKIAAIGSHGQTVCHNTQATIPYTLQLGCAHTIAFLTGIQVVADFRTGDLVNGGQGAPFAPLYHQELFSGDNTAVVNIGGIANISFISPKKPTQGYDVGPGNCLLDAWIYQNLKLDYDKDGAWAGQGKVIPALLESLWADPFFSMQAPKSIGKEYFSLEWLTPHLKSDYLAEDVQATLCALTALSIADSVNKNTFTIHSLYLCGGGTHNLFLRKCLSDLLPNVTIKSSAEAGIHPDYLEAMMFAWLAERCLNKVPLDLTHITGSKKPLILGAVYSVGA